MENLPKKIVKTDVICIGGGPAGLMAAIRAGEMGAKVVLADKANTQRSGNGSGGNDHIECYIPEFHGQDPGPFIKEYFSKAQLQRSILVQAWIENSFEMVKLWNSWGIPMKYEGKWEFAGHALPGRPRTFLKYAGGNQKPVLTREALKRGVQIMNRVTVFELLKNKDRVVGALGLDTKNEQIIEFQAKAVVLATGGCERLYPSSTPNYMFNLPYCPYVTGDGRAMFLRAGGRLADLEFLGHWAGPKYYARAGKATWIGVFRDPDGKPIGPFINKPDRVYGDITSDMWTTVYDDYMKSGKGPVFIDHQGASKEDMEYMRYWMLNEGNKGLLDHMAEEGIDPSTHAIEFRTYERRLTGGICYNPKGETTIEGLFSAGDEYFSGMGFAATFGWIAGENSANYAKVNDLTPSEEKNKIKEKQSMLKAILNREQGSTWREANIALQQIMYEYAGAIRAESILDQGLRNLERLETKVYKTLLANNGHELGRCLEVLSLLDIGKSVLLCARERRETRGRHNRVDYPFTNPLMDKYLFIKMVNGKAVFEWEDRSKY